MITGKALIIAGGVFSILVQLVVRSRRSHTSASVEHLDGHDREGTVSQSKQIAVPHTSASNLPTQKPFVAQNAIVSLVESVRDGAWASANATYAAWRASLAKVQMAQKHASSNWQSLQNAGGCVPVMAVDNDTCLQQSPGWQTDTFTLMINTCSNSFHYCLEYAKDMKRCCPQTCGSGILTKEQCMSLPGQGTCTYPNGAQVCEGTAEAKRQTKITDFFNNLHKHLPKKQNDTANENTPPSFATPDPAHFVTATNYGQEPPSHKWQLLKQHARDHQRRGIWDDSEEDEERSSDPDPADFVANNYDREPPSRNWQILKEQNRHSQMLKYWKERGAEHARDHQRQDHQREDYDPDHWEGSHITYDEEDQQRSSETADYRPTSPWHDEIRASARHSAMSWSFLVVLRSLALSIS